MGALGPGRFRVFIPEPEWPEANRVLGEVAEVVVGDPRVRYDEDVLAGLLRDFDAVIITSQHRVSRRVISSSPRLRVIGKYGSRPGVDNVDLEAATERGIPVVYSGEANADSVAEHTVALILCLLKRVCFLDSFLRRGGWRGTLIAERSFGRELRGKTVGIVGLGAVGRRVARILQGFGVRLLGYDPYVLPEALSGIDMAIVRSLDELLRESDVVTIHARLTPETYHMIGERELRQELLELRSRAAGANLTEVVAAIDRLLQKLGEVENRTAEEPDARRWMPDLLEVKAWLQVIRARLGEVYKQVPVSAVDKTFESVVGKAEELLKEVREVVEFLRKKSKEVVCIAVYPPPPVCAVLQELPKLLEWAENAIKEAEAVLLRAREAYEQGRKVEALLLANRALATLTVVRARLEPVYRLVKQATEGPAVTPGPRVSATATIESLGGARYRLTLSIRNEDGAPVEVDRVTVVVTPAIELRVGVSVAPGEARTVTLQFSVNPIQLTQLRASKTVAVLVRTSAGDVIAVNATVK